MPTASTNTNNNGIKVFQIVQILVSIFTPIIVATQAWTLNSLVDLQKDVAAMRADRWTQKDHDAFATKQNEILINQMKSMNDMSIVMTSNTRDLVQLRKEVDRLIDQSSN